MASGASSIERLRVGLGDAVRQLLAGESGPPRFVDDDPGGSGGGSGAGVDTGLFGPGSATWTVHSDLSMLVGGVRALFLQTLHPLAMAGVADHSAYRTDPLGRLHRTGSFVGATTFGSTADAEAAIEVVKAVHVHVEGVAPDGRPYSATDPHLLRWVHITEVDSFLRGYLRYGASPLPADEADGYVAEMAEVGRRLGAERLPESRAELARSLQEFRPELRSGEQARDAVRFLLAPPSVPLASRGPYAVIAAASIGLLPSWVRRELRLPMVPLAEPLAVRPAVRTILRGLGWALGPHPATAATL